jgi:hypothetical protein
MMSSVEDAWLDEQYEAYWADEDEAWREQQMRDEYLVMHEADLVEFRNGWFDYLDEECV